MKKNKMLVLGLLSLLGLGNAVAETPKAGKHIFATLEAAAAEADKATLLGYFLSYDDLQTLMLSDKTNEAFREKIKEIKKAEWENRIDEKIDDLGTKLGGRTLRFDRAKCVEKAEDNFPYLNCKVRFFIQEYAINIEGEVIPINNAYRIVSLADPQQE